MKNLTNIIICILIIASCGRDNKNNGAGGTNAKDLIGNPDTTSGKPVPTPKNSDVKIYYENSKSMDGYIRKNTDFKDVLRELLVAIDNNENIASSANFYLINNDLQKTDFGVESVKIADELTPNSTDGIGNKSFSDFEKILNTILQNQDKNTISIVIADFIYSPNESNIPSSLNKLKTYTKDAFLKAIKDNNQLEARIFRFYSDFNGIYYDINNKEISGIDKRPYYYFMIADSKLMQELNDKIASQLKEMDGYHNEALFTTNVYSNIPRKILSTTSTNGRLRVRNNNLEIISYTKDKFIEFVVLFDFSNLPMNNNFLMNKENYESNPDTFSIVDIGVKEGKRINFQESGSTNIKPSDLVAIKGKRYTHAVKFKTNGTVSNDLEFSLNKKIPSWVNKYHSRDDRNIKNDSIEKLKTFGFKSLVEGISEAYLLNREDKYFRTSISIE